MTEEPKSMRGFFWHNVRYTVFITLGFPTLLCNKYCCGLQETILIAPIFPLSLIFWPVTLPLAIIFTFPIAITSTLLIYDVTKFMDKFIN